MTEHRYIAAVLVTCVIDGVRTDIQPEHPIPESLPRKQLAELLRSRSVRDLVAERQRDQQIVEDFRRVGARALAERYGMSVAEVTGIYEERASR